MSCKLSLSLLLTLWVGLATPARIIIESPILTNWGTWGPMERCPPGTKVIKMQVKTEPWSAWDAVTDDSCLNAIKFGCGNPQTGDVTSMIMSKEGTFGKWGNMFSCNGQGYAVGFMIRVKEQDTAIIDETATNNLRILCAGSPNGFMELDGERWGQWTNPRICESNEYICGLQTQVENDQGMFTDDTSLNNIRVECCDLTKEELEFYGIQKNVTAH